MAVKMIGVSRLYVWFAQFRGGCKWPAEPFPAPSPLSPTAPSIYRWTNEDETGLENWNGTPSFHSRSSSKEIGAKLNASSINEIELAPGKAKCGYAPHY
ncbi:hypothetical protein V1478_003023 [Vespula squamosa]|uniref:Uncharacterized protein n=1 Tax=Vespula squamosa TaxID=30214 RepID=A0ABD2BRH3_VESSQ